MNDTAVRAIPRKVHLVGVGGIHMSAIAKLLRARGHEVTGSDLHLSPLTDTVREMGVGVCPEGHRAENIDDAELVVYTSAAQETNPELAAARERGIPTIKRGEMVAWLQEGKQVIAVAGAHGKTTTSALIAFMLSRAGLDPTFMIGGIVRDFGTNAMPGEGKHFVVEADEYDRAFLNYHPHVAVVTNIEPDHLDIYGSLEELQRAFAQFLAQVDNSGFIIACTDSPPVRAILPPTVGDDMIVNPVHVVSYSLHKEADWTAENIVSKGVDGLSFVVKFRKQHWGDVTTNLPGAHNVANSLAAIAVGETLGISRADITAALAEFQGAERRFQMTGEAAGVIIVDSYAHHPTEIRADLAAARMRFPDRRIVALFQPHTYTRTAYLLDDFRTCFGDADALYIADTYAAREEPDAGMNAEQLADEVSGAIYAGSVDDAAAVVARDLREGDVFLTVGAGDVDRAGPEVLRILQER